MRKLIFVLVILFMVTAANAEILYNITDLGTSADSF